MTILLARFCALGLACWLVLACGLGAQQEVVAETITPVLLEVRDAPVAFAGSDGKTHLVYELRMTNFSSGNATIEQVEVIGDAGAVSKTMDKTRLPGGCSWQGSGRRRVCCREARRRRYSFT